MNKLTGNRKFIDQMVGWTPKTLLEKKLILGIFHKKNHRDVLEDLDEIVEPVKQ